MTDEQQLPRSVEHKPQASLASGSDGAIMVIGLFMAMFLVGMLYFAIGVGETILYRERMQDASDAAAFSAAVMDARGMNLIALINIIMAAALAVLVALRTVELLCWAGIALAGALAVPTWGASLAVIPPINAVRTAVNSAYNVAEPIVNEVLEIGHQAGRVVRAGMPAVAQGKAVLIVMRQYRPPAQFGFVYPIYRPLPTEDAPFSWLCDRAKTYVVELVLYPLRSLGLLSIPFVGGFISGAVNAFVGTAAATVCGGSATVPNLGVDFSVSLPETDLSRQCTQNGDSATCSAARNELQRQAYDPATGNCTTGTPPGAVASDCRGRLSDAAAACQPGSGRRLEDFRYQVREMIQVARRLVDDPATPQDESATIVWDVPQSDPSIFPNPHVRATGTQVLCGSGGVLNSTYNGGSDFLCEPDRAVLAARGSVDSLLPGRSVEIPYTRALEVLGCKEHRDQPNFGTSSNVSGGDDRSPQRVTDGLQMGADEFQIRAFVLGDTQFDRFDRGVQVANRFQDDASATSSVFEGLRQLGRISVAQAEFYYAGEEPPVEWLFNMRWRARFRRFRMPNGVNGSSLQDACSSTNEGAGGGCNTGGLDLSFLERVIIH